MTRCWKPGSDHDLFVNILLPFESYIFQPLVDLSRHPHPQLDLQSELFTARHDQRVSTGDSKGCQFEPKEWQQERTFGCLWMYQNLLLQAMGRDMHPFQAVFAGSLR